MKKLMFVAAAAVCGSLFAGDEITSANIVGYLGQERQAAAPAFGATFIPVNGATTFKLGEITVVSGDEENPFDPDQEFIQFLDPDTTLVSGSYTCLTQQMADFYRNFIEDEDTAALIENNLGWWDFEFGNTLNNIAGGTAVNRNNESFNIGQGFLGSMSNAAKRKFTTAGAVPLASKAIELQASAPFFCNYLPVAITLSQITVESGDDENPFDPDQEFIQVLDPDTTLVSGCYTCLTQQMADYYRDIVEDPDTATLIENNLGWWDFEFGNTLSNISAGTATARGTEVVQPGFAFMCSMSNAAVRKFNFPPAIAPVE